MVDQPEKPDFVADAFGNVEDVHRQKYARGPTPAPMTFTNIPSQPGKEFTQKNPTFRTANYSSGALFIILIMGILFIGRLVLYAVVTRQNEVNNTYNQANRSYLESNVDQAISQFTQAIQEKANYGQAYNDPGLVYQQLGEYTQALADANQVVKSKPDSAIVYNDRGLAYLALGSYDEAIADFDRAVQIYDEFAKAYFNRGQAYFVTARYEQSIADFTLAIEHLQHFPELLKTASAKGIADQPGDFSAEMVLYSMDIDLGTVYESRGSAYFALGNLDLAIADYDQVIQLQPDRSSAYLNRGLANTTRMDNDKAILDFKKVLDLANDPSAQEQAERLLETLGAK
jgi:tetratricopeptide (TPR) repeat protein